MGVRQSIFTRATSHAGLSALIGSRCYPDQLPEDVTLPALRYQLVSTPPQDYRDHDSNPPDRWIYRYQIDGWDSTPDAAATLGQEMKNAFEGWANGTAVGWCRVENEFGERDIALNQYRRMIEIVIDHAI
jgi:hypothetical protein